MRRRLRFPLEFVLAALVISVLLYGGRWLDRALGWPSADERLLIAAAAGDDAAFASAIRAGASARYHDARGATALMFAAGTGSRSRTSRLLVMGAAVDAADQRGRTPLMYAATNDQADMVTLLLRHGADPSRLDRGGQTALELASAVSADRAAAALGPPHSAPAIARGSASTAPVHAGWG